MAGFLQSNPWGYGPYSTPSMFGPGSAIPVNYAAASPFAPQPMVQLQQLQQLLQILPQQILQLQQTIQVLPQHVAQLVVQTLIQSQALVGTPAGQPFQVTGAGSPFPSIQTGTPFPNGQTGYVM
ncbi:MAG TPA: hypothetical protein VIX35_02730 [Vicinamibacterales bacterium]